MSDTFSIACKDCEEQLWIGQGHDAKDLRIYTAEKRFINFKRFLLDHQWHNLVFYPNSYDEVHHFKDYEEIAKAMEPDPTIWEEAKEIFIGEDAQITPSAPYKVP